MTSTSSSEPDNDPAKAAAYIRLSTLGFQVVITFVVLALAGIWIDDQYDVSPWGTLGGIGLGLVAMVKILLHEGQRVPGSKSSHDVDGGEKSGEAND